MTAIYQREMRSYLTSAVGYVFLAVFYAIAGYYFFATSLVSNSTDLSYVFSNLFSIVIFLVPMLTMRLFSEERRQKTEQALFTAPVSFTGVVMGKFLACFFVFFVASTLGLLPAVAMSFFSNPPWGEIIGNYIGTLLYGGAMISIGVFISSLTVSQIIAAIGTFIVSILLMYIDMVASTVNNTVVSTIVEWISFTNRYTTFAQGLFSISSTVFFLSVAAVFVFLTARRLESRRWS